MKDDGKAPVSYEEMNSLDGWEELGTFKQEKGLWPYTDRWCNYSWNSMNYDKLNEEKLTEAEAEFMEILVPLQMDIAI